MWQEDVLIVMMAISGLLVLAGVVWVVCIAPISIPLKLIIAGVTLAVLTSFLAEAL